METSTSLPLPTGVMPSPDFAGTYGDRVITLESDGYLYLKRPGTMRLKLLPKYADVFKLEIMPSATIVFLRDAANTITGIKVSKGDGHWKTSRRNGDAMQEPV